MKRLFLLLISVIVTLSAFASGDTGISFYEGTWKEALAEAKAADKILFVDAYAQWCGPCKRMAKDVFTDASVGEFFNDNFINLKLDMETADGRTFDSAYPVSAYPTLYFLGVDGEVVKKVRGAQQVQSLIQHGKEAIAGYDRSGDFEAAYNEGDRSYDLVHRYTKALIAAKKPYLKVANDYLRSNPDITREQRDQYVYDAAWEFDSSLFEEMISRSKEIKAMVGTEAFDGRVRTVCLQTVDKALEYDYPELMDQAIDVARDHLSSGGKTFGYEARRRYARMINDKENYIIYANLYAKDQKFNNETLEALISEMTQHFKSDKKVMETAAEYVDKSLKYGMPNVKTVAQYAEILVLADNVKDAKKLLKEASENKKYSERDLQNIEGLKNYIDNLQPLK